MSSLNLDAVQSEPIWERVIGVLRREIVMGELAHGSHLKEPSLARRFGVSRLPIREAIAELSREGVVQILPRRGAFVIGITDQDITDIYECRTMIELAAIRRVAVTIDAQGIADLNLLVDQMDDAVAAGLPRLLAAADMMFHRRIVELSKNRALIASWERLAPLIETILDITDTSCVDLLEAAGGHRRITTALANHDTAEAVALMTTHLPSGEPLVHRAMQSVREGQRLGLRPA
jgi:DNA-binding GntR family transcriptional regulator